MEFITSSFALLITTKNRLTDLAFTLGKIKYVLDTGTVEFVIFDDGSTDKDELVKIINKYPGIKFYSRENKGQYNTLNDGLKLATGDIITIISADDIYWNVYSLNDLVNFWGTHPQYDIIYGKTWHINSKGESLPIQKLFLSGPFPKWLLRHYSLTYHCSLFIKKDIIFENSIFFDPNFRYFGDWDWIIRLSQFKIGYIKTYISAIRWHDEQTFINGNPRVIMNERNMIFKRYKLSFFVHRIILNVLKCRFLFIKLIYHKWSIFGCHFQRVKS